MTERVIRNFGAIAVNTAAWGFWLSLAGLVIGVTATSLFSVTGRTSAVVFLAPVAVAGALAVWRASRIALVLGDAEVRVTNFHRRWTVPAAAVRRIVPSRTGFPASLPCAGLDIEGIPETVPIAATTSWGWRFGHRPSRQSQQIVEQLKAWAAEANLPAPIEAVDLF